jgi:arsenite-transporting ATPase
VSAANALVERLPRTTLILGKGGVGKTTCAAALALCSAKTIGPTLVLSTDPARALPTVLAHDAASAPTPVRYAGRLSAQVLDAGALRARFMERWNDVIRMILDRGTYLDQSDIGPLVETAMPGSDEIFAALELAELMIDNGTRPRAESREPRAEFERIVVDTAPTGHTLRLLNLPKTFRSLVQLLDAMQSKHRFMVRALTRTYRPDSADAFLKEMTGLVSALEQSLRDPQRSAAVLVTNPQSLVLEETRRYLEALRDLQIHVAAVVWNGVDGDVVPLGDAQQFVVPTLDSWPTGEKGLERWLAELKPISALGSRPSALGARISRKDSGMPTAERREPRADITALIRPLTIVAGKGGVGKTTVACVLGLSAGDTKRTLLVSTDPAPSLADAFARPIPDEDTRVEGAPKLFARQMDASAAFARLRGDYQAKVDSLFQGLVAGGVDLTHDRAIARDLLALAPPGVDEVYALSLLSGALFEDHYECVIVDPAPTGHLLRLLEMPELALAWSHQLLRLMLKYKDVTGLGETAREILEFSRSLRAVDALLRDLQKCAVVIVTLDQPVVRAETERLAAEVRRRRVPISGVVLNRAARGAALPVADAPLHFEAPPADPPPVGIAALREWGDSWRAVTRDG